MSEAEQRPGIFQGAMGRGLALGCGIQIAVCLTTGLVGMAITNMDPISNTAGERRLVSWTLMGGAVAAMLILLGVSLRLGHLHKRDKARGVALSIPLAFVLGLALAAGLFLLLLFMCGGSPF